MLLIPFVTLILSFIPAAISSKPHTHTHNIDNPHRYLLKRSITNDATTVSGKSFDFVIVGGGLAGLTIGSRLSEWSNVTVLVIEAGGDGSDVEDQINIPGYSYLHSLTGSAYDWQYKTTAQTDSLGLTYTWPRGKGLGGSGAINGLFWCRGGSSEYDAWASLNPGGAQTWNWEEVNKYIMKAENFSQPNATVQQQFGMVLNASAHGSGGPIQAGFSEYIFPVVANWIPAWIKLGFTAKDLAGGDTHGVMITPSTLNMRNQTRSDSKAGYIDPLPPRNNLVILTGQQVTQINFNGSKDASGNIIASGVQFQATVTGTSYSVTANKEVILAGGTIGSAQLLQLSGIGPQALLSGLGITSRLDLPVGYNLQDHVSYSMYWSTPEGTLTWANLSASTTLQASELTEYETYHTGMWTYVNEAVGYPSMSDIAGGSAAASTYASEVQSALAATVSDVTSWSSLPSNVATGLAAQYAIQQKWLTEDNGQLEIILTTLGQGTNTLGIQVALQHPWSRGSVFINSTSAFTQPAINPDYFGVGYDADIINFGSEFARTVAAANPLSTVMLTETLPGATVTGDALTNYTKQHCGTEYHPLGTCSMLPQDSGGVVDTNLLVYGAANLRVIDASIIPLHISAHLMATTYGIAEKGADIIKGKYAAFVATSSSASGGATTTSGSGSGASGTAVSGNNSLEASNGMSTTAKIGVGVGAGVGALALLGGLIAFCCIRRKRKAPKPVDKGWYASGANNDAWDTGAAYKEAHGHGAYPLTNLQAPVVPYGKHQRGISHSGSVDTMATADLASRTPMQQSDSYHHFPEGEYSRGGAASPYRDYDGDDYHHSGYNTPGGYGTPPLQPFQPQPQHYHPVQPR